MHPAKLITLFFIANFIAVTVCAQKQAPVQEGSIRAPDNIKIDGQLKEWKHTNILEAYNPGSRVYYVVSNDDQNLYLAIRGLGTRVVLKSLSGGFTFIISHDVVKKTRAKAAGNVAITFPVAQDEQTTMNIMAPLRALNNFISDTLGNKRQIDSVVAEANKRLIASVRDIKVSGIKEISDSVISIYNTDGIKAAARFEKRQPIFELAIPLKYLGLNVNDGTKFSYCIRLTGLPPEPLPPGVAIDPGPVDADDAYIDSLTEFWGEYILAKKP